MECSLHRQLKEQYGPLRGGRTEVVVEGYRADAVSADGRLIEVQVGPLARLRGKLDRLLPAWRVDVIKPVTVSRRVIRRDRRDGEDRSPRRSPKRGSLLDVFDELVTLARIFPHPNLTIDVLGVEVDEVRLARRGRPGYEVLDRRLAGVVDSVSLRVGDDLWSLLPPDLPERFTSFELALAIGRPVDFARRVAYCLAHGGAAEVVEKAGRRRVFARCPALVSSGSSALSRASPGR